jgi:glycopeptide antibiotics resistance protein
MAILAAWAWRPFLPEVTLAGYQEKFDTPWYIPLAALARQVDFFSVVDVCTPFFLYLPLGALLAAWPWRREGALAGPLPGVLLALALEVGQVVILYRMLDVTDAIVTASGVLVGWAVMRRAGYRPYGETFPFGATRA